MGSASSTLTQYDIEDVQQHCNNLFSQQEIEVLIKVMQEAGYSKDSSLLLDDFVKILDHPGLKMEVEVPVD
ncbi:hypothetical protein L1987_87253 [Smallanthus sonchifolius]|nr:hypothetical protein L1987_87253 [Smallanthus sonchifolius]